MLLKIEQNQLLVNENIETLNEKYWIITQQFRDESDSAELKWDSIEDLKNKSPIHKIKPENSIARILNCLQCWLTQNYEIEQHWSTLLSERIQDFERLKD